VNSGITSDGSRLDETPPNISAFTDRGIRRTTWWRLTTGG